MEPLFKQCFPPESVAKLGKLTLILFVLLSTLSHNTKVVLKLLPISCKSFPNYKQNYVIIISEENGNWNDLWNTGTGLASGWIV